MEKQASNAELLEEQTDHVSSSAHQFFFYFSSQISKRLQKLHNQSVYRKRSTFIKLNLLMKLKYKKVVCRMVLTGRGVNIFMHKWRPRYFPKDTAFFGVRKSSSDFVLLLWSAAHSYSVRSDKCYKSQKCGIFFLLVARFICFINLKLFSRDLKLKWE